MIKTYKIEVIQSIEVTVDESKFDQKFFDEFNGAFYNFGNSIEKHAKHLGQMYARGVVSDFTDFIEGYGPVKEFGIVFQEDGFEVDLLGCNVDISA